MLSFLHKKIISLWNIVKLQKRLDVFGAIFLLTVFISGWFLFTKQTDAQSIMDSVKDLSLALSDLTLWIAGLFLKLTIFVLKFVIEIGGYNGYLDSQAVTVGWVMVRDVVNMGFVVILLVIAFGTILGLEQYEWKKMIVKFILAAILVNFSRTICGLIIDAAQVVMITFVNGVAATAGGNLIGAFHADKIMSLSNDATSIGLDPQAVFVASTAALMFTVMMLVTMSIYLIILLFRMISLWVLIVLSPMAFVASVIPQTQKYASEWWKEFINNVISGPLLIFFLWLAFVTLGSGQVHNQISDPKYNSLPASALFGGEGSTALQDIQGVGQAAGFGNNTGQSATAAAGITSVMTWDSMANFFIALAMLLVGAKKAQELGVMGSSMLGKVSDIGKKAFMIASGVGTGLWAARQVGKGLEKVQKGAGVAAGTLGAAALWVTPYERIKNAALRQVEGVKSWSARNPDQVIKTQAKMVKDEKTGEMVEARDEHGEVIREPVYKRDEQGKLTNELEMLTPEEVTEQRKMVPWAGLQATIYKSRMKKIESRKKLKRTTDFAKGREDLMSSYAQAKPTYWMQGKDEKFDAFDRIEGGILEAMKARSEAKTKDFRSLGRKFASSHGRFKYEGGVLQQDERGTLTQQTAAHETRATGHEASLAKGKEQAMREYAEGKEPWTNKWTQGVGGGPKVHEIIAKLKLETEGEKTAFQKVESEAAAKAAMAPLGLQIIAAKQAAEMATEIAKDIVKDTNQEAKLHLEKDANPESIYNKLVKQQAESKILQDEISSTEKMAMNKFLGREYADAAKVEEEAQKKLDEADGIQTDEAKRLREDAKKFLKEMSDYKLRKRQYEQAVDAAPDDASRNVAQNKLKEFIDGKSSIAGENGRGEAYFNDQQKEYTGAMAEIKIQDDNLPEPQKTGQKNLRDEAAMIRQKSLAWRYAAAKAQEEEVSSDFNVSHNGLLSQVEQAVVHAKRGVKTPTTALTMPIEKYAKDFVGMDYEMFVTSLGGNFTKMSARHKNYAAAEARYKQTGFATDKAEMDKNEVTNADKAETAALLIHGQKNGWIDDGIPSLLDSSLSGEAKTELGWDNYEFNNKKINDLMSMFASGGNFKFAGMHSKIGDVMDHAVKNMGINIPDFFEKLEKGFTDLEMEGFKQVEDDLKKRYGGAFNLKDYVGSQASIGGAGDEKRKQNIDFYKKELKENQAQLQLIGNMRDQAASSPHPENGGHGKFVTMKDGSSMYVLTGQKMAKDAVYAEVRKTSIGTRAGMQSHATMKIDEEKGFATAVDEQLNSWVRGDINNANDHRGTNVRYENQTSGLNVHEEKDDYISRDKVMDESGNEVALGFCVDGLNARGLSSERHKWLMGEQKEKYSKAHSSAGLQESEASLEEAQAQLTTNDIVENLFAPRMRSAMPDFLLTMAKQGGVNDMEALSQGRMNISVRVKGQRQHIGNVQKLIDLYNDGAFGSKPKTKISNFNPSEARGGKSKASGGATSTPPSAVPKGKKGRK